VIVCADHGELHGEFGLLGHEFAVYDPLVNVPLLVKHPGLDPGRTDRQIELLDLYDTVLETAGATEVPPTVGARGFEPGRSLLSPGRPIDDGEYAFIEYGRPDVELTQLESKAAAAGLELDPASRFYSRMRAVRRPGGKYIENELIDDEAYRLDGSGTEAAQLDPDGSRATALRAALDRFVRNHGASWEADRRGPGTDPPIPGMDGATRRRLRELGYLE